MRLLVVTNDYPPKPGGIQQYLGNLVGAYPHPVHVVAPADPRAEPDERVTRGRHRFLWPTRSTRELVVAAAERFRPDVVLFGAPHPLPAMGPDLRRRLGVPYGIVAHGAEVTIPAVVPVVRSRLAGLFADADVRFAVSRYTARRVERLCGAPVDYLGAGVDVDEFHPSTSPRSDEVPVVGCVSRFVPRKGQDRLLRAVARLDRPVRVLLVGKGRKERSLRRLAARLGLDVRFEIDVPWERLADCYRAMDVFAMPCRTRWFGLEVEGLGLVFLEAAASGLPVLAGDSGGAPETVVPGRTGFVVRSLDDLVEGLEMLLDDPDLARSMGEAGRRRVEEEFVWSAVVDRLEEGLRRAVFRKGAP
ncbi:MAG TPA: glycosyltransferase family 1 protein [Actinobacteria bacterium]|nr:glycosyltransferase family 1 protein [Actinomycetota bacterium]